MATPKIVADFETQLATALSVGDTSFTLASATDDDGVSLPAGKYYFTIDNGTTIKEYVVGTVSGTSVTSVSNVTRQGTESSGVDRAHRVGASVIISDFLTYKNYIDETTVAGAADGDTNTKGVFEGATLAEVRARTATGSTGAALVITPDVADDMPTADEKTAMAGGEDFGTPSSTNKFLTEDWNTSNPKIVKEVFSSSGTWTKDDGLVGVFVQVWGGGASGYGITDNDYREGDGGAGGGYDEMWIPASLLGATETVTVGAGGAAGSLTVSSGSLDSIPQNNGGSTSFGSWLTADGGVDRIAVIASYSREIFDSGAGADASTFNRNGGSVIYAGGGGAGASCNSGGGAAGTGGTSKQGGDGGNSFATAASSGSFAADDGVVPGGGGGAIAVYGLGGGSLTITTGAGGDGQVIVTEYYV